MKNLTFVLFLFLTTQFCSCENDKFTSVRCNNATLATVKDLTGLDGCGFIFELSDGTRLEPMRLFYCGTPPLPSEVTEDPLFNFQFMDGKKVYIVFEEITDAASICMVGKVVKITCIEAVDTNE